jgi:hypothetical protein
LTSCIEWCTSMTITSRTTTTMNWTWTWFTWITTWDTITLITNSIWISRWKTIDNRFTWRLNTNNHIYNTKYITRKNKEKKYWWFHLMTVYDKWWYSASIMTFNDYYFLRFVSCTLSLFILRDPVRMTIWMKEKICCSTSNGIRRYTRAAFPCICFVVL